MDVVVTAAHGLLKIGFVRVRRIVGKVLFECSFSLKIVHLSKCMFSGKSFVGIDLIIIFWSIRNYSD